MLTTLEIQPGSWKPTVLDKLLADAECAGKGLEVWLREKFFEQHAKRFHHRPFIWHVWDGLKDGFAALVPDCDTERLVYFASDYVLAGPAADPAKSAEAGSIQDAFARIAEGKFPFVSRGDLSATHATEAALWPSSLGITTNPASVSTLGEWYFSGNANMSASLTMANEMEAYILSDKATFLAFQANGGSEG